MGIVISGDPFNEGRSFIAHLYMKYPVIVIDRVAGNNNTTVIMKLTGLSGVDVVVPKLFSNNGLRAMWYRLLLIDGLFNKEN